MEHAHHIHKNKQAVFSALRYYYQCFLVHFLLGLSGCAVLFFLLFRFTQAVTTGELAQIFEHATFPLHDKPPQSISCFLLEDSVYCMSAGTMQPAFAAAKAGTPRSSTQTDLSAKNPAPVQQITQPLPKETQTAELLQQPPVSTVTKDSLYTYDKTAAKAGNRLLVPIDMSASAQKNDANQGILFSNQTDYVLHAADYLTLPYPLNHLSYGTEDAPLVLIIHTHGTEAYAPDHAKTVSDTFHARSTDITENVVAVGDKLAETLSSFGIGVLHCQTMFDETSYTASYTAAADYIRETVEKYPSIQYVFDVHRDALESADGSIYRPVTLINGEVSAQVMLVVGSDAGGADYPAWKDHLTAAVHLQDKLNQTYPGFARPINVRCATFNAQYAPGSLLLEIGASGNSLEEARCAAYYLGQAMGKIITRSAP